MGMPISQEQRLPAEAECRFITYHHDQTQIQFDVFEGPWLMAARNRRLATFTLKRMPPKEAGVETVPVKFKFDHDGILTGKHDWASVQCATCESDQG
jgi:molecular chaperone DnaK (HSP70)